MTLFTLVRVLPLFLTRVPLLVSFFSSEVPLRITQEIPRRGPILIDSLTPTRFNSAPRAFPNEDVAFPFFFPLSIRSFFLFFFLFPFRTKFPLSGDLSRDTLCGNFGNFLPYLALLVFDVRQIIVLRKQFFNYPS